MKYLGSKNRLSKELVPIIESYFDSGTKWYIEPFVGGANIIDKISFANKIGSDVNRYLIELLIFAQNPANEIPTEISEEEYVKVKDNKDDYPDWYVALVGFCATYSAKWFAGYARSFKSDGITPRNMSAEAIRNVEKQRKYLNGITFFHKDFSEYENTSNSVFYCDIPYKDTTKYAANNEFDYEKFYDWCRKMKERGNIVLISEYAMPDDFICVWEKEHATGIASDKVTHSKRIERLFVIGDKTVVNVN